MNVWLNESLQGKQHCLLITQSAELPLLIENKFCKWGVLRVIDEKLASMIFDVILLYASTLNFDGGWLVQCFNLLIIWSGKQYHARQQETVSDQNFPAIKFYKIMEDTEQQI